MQPSPGPGHTDSHFQRKRELDKKILTVAGLHLLPLCSQHQAHSRVLESASGLCSLIPAGFFFPIFKHSLLSSVFRFCQSQLFDFLHPSSPLLPHLMQNNRQEHQAKGGDVTTVQTWKFGLRKSKPHLDLNFTKDVNGNKKGSCRHHSSKRTTRENMGLLRKGAGVL